MNELITTKRLQTLIATDADMDEAFVQVFLKEMVELIIEVINKGDEVVVDGLGTFRRVTVSGGQNTRLVFFPDRSMKEGVNAPFAQFEPFIICQGDIANSHQIQHDSEQNHVEHSMDLAEISPKSESRVNQDEKRNIEQIGKESIPSDRPGNLIPEDESGLLKDQALSEEPIYSSVVTSIDSEESATIQEKSAMDKKVEKAESREYQQNMHQIEEPVEVSDGNGQLTERIDKTVDEVMDEDDEPEETCATGACGKVSSHLSSKRYGLWAVIILLAVCIVGTMVYFFIRIYQNEKASESTEQIAPVVVSQYRTMDTVDLSTGLSDSYTEPIGSGKVQENAAPASNLSTSPETPSEHVEQAPSKVPDDIENEDVETGRDASRNLNKNKTQKSQIHSKHFTKPSLSQFPLEVVLQSGERLTLLSLRYYGHKAFWVYIYEANKSKYPDPDNIPAGASLRIPSPAILGINPDDSVSIQKALDRASKL